MACNFAARIADCEKPVPTFRSFAAALPIAKNRYPLFRFMLLEGTGMLTVAQANIVPIVIALLVGLVAGWWILRRAAKGAAKGSIPVEKRPPATRGQRDGREGNRLQDEVAAATADVAGEILGVEAHSEIPGASGPPNDLQMLKGVGPRLAVQLNEAGISRFDQLAGLGANEVALLDSKMGAFAGRIARDRLVEQALYLARDDKDGFEARFGKLGGGG
jgi:predicted flap endonuclease-1-like 5' DNA nuclease